MGIPATMNLLRRNSNSWCQTLRLKDSKLIVDVTGPMYWFAKNKLLQEYPYRIDRFGFDMVLYGRFIRDFFNALKQAHVTPIVVYSGARPSQQEHGDLASKARYLEYSSRIRMYKLRRYENRLDDTVVPSLADNVIKQVINEFGLEAHQCIYEVYPMLAQLAEQNDCPVMTSHSDFIFMNVKRGFFLAEDFSDSLGHGRVQVPSEIPVNKLYLNRAILNEYGLDRCGPALVTLYTLLRSDFSGRHYRALNELFKDLPNEMKFIRDDTEFVRGRRPNGQQYGRRLEHILSHWPKHLTTTDAVRRDLASMTYLSDGLLRDFDTIHGSFSEPHNYMDTIGQIIHLSPVKADNLHKALTKRESTADFVMDIMMKQRLFNRGCLEDIETYRSTYSLADPVRKCLMKRSNVNTLSLLDRQNDDLHWRDIVQSSTDEPSEFRRNHLTGLFSFPRQAEDAQTAIRFMGTTRMGQALSDTAKDELLVLLLLARYSLDMVARRNYDSRPIPSSQITGAASSDSGPLSNLDPLSIKYRIHNETFLTAIFNCFFYHAFITRETHPSMLDMDALNNRLVDDANNNSVLPKIREACKEIESDKIRNPDPSDPNYMICKHLIEALNMSLHAYMEINSLYGYPSIKLSLPRYYSGVLIYKLMRYQLAKRAGTSLLQIEPSLLDIISS